MTQPLPSAVEVAPRRPGQPATLADIVAAEATRVAAGTSDPCGDTCLCHGGLVCARAAHPHDPDADMGASAPRGNVVPHAGYDPDGQLVQWTCHDEATRAMTAADHAAAALKARAEHTRSVLGGLDPDVLREYLARTEDK